MIFLFIVIRNYKKVNSSNYINSSCSLFNRTPETNADQTDYFLLQFSQSIDVIHCNIQLDSREVCHYSSQQQQKCGDACHC